MSICAKKKVAIYPFTPDSIGTYNYLGKLRTNYCVVELISPNGLGLTGKDAGIADNRNAIGITVSGNIYLSLSKFDVLLIASGDEKDDIHKHSYEYMKLAIENKKDIICAMTLCKDRLIEVQNKCKENNVDFFYCANALENSDEFKFIQSQSEILYTLSTPIIFIGGLIDNADNQEILLSIASKLTLNGYKVSAICNQRECEFYGYHSYPSFLKSKEHDENSKIIGFNHFVKCIDQKDKPDVILIQIPGGMIKYNSMLTNDFGIYAYLVSQAIQPDYFICCTMYGAYPSSFYTQISNDFLHRFGFEIDCIHMSNKLIDGEESMQRQQLRFLSYPRSHVTKVVYESNKYCTIPIYDLLNEIDNEKMFLRMVDDLIQYQSAYSIF